MSELSKSVSHLRDPLSDIGDKTRLSVVQLPAVNNCGRICGHRISDFPSEREEASSVLRYAMVGPGCVMPLSHFQCHRFLQI